MNYNELATYMFGDGVPILKLTERLCLDVIERSVPGDFAEAGCAYGVHGIVMKHVAGDRKVYLFDSFQGIPCHGSEDEEWTDVHGASVSDQRKSGGITVCDFNEVVKTMYKFLPKIDNIFFKKGWFIDTFPELTNERFSVLRLDCDLYESYMLCFKYLLPRLERGGWLIIDDFILNGCKKAIVDSGINLDCFTVENKIAYLKWE